MTREVGGIVIPPLVIRIKLLVRDPRQKGKLWSPDLLTEARQEHQESLYIALSPVNRPLSTLRDRVVRFIRRE
jgi:hypothetical protein